MTIPDFSRGPISRPWSGKLRRSEDRAYPWAILRGYSNSHSASKTTSRRSPTS